MALTAHWIQAALVLWTAGLLLLGGYIPLLRRQIALLETVGTRDVTYRRTAAAGRVLGAVSGFVIVLIVYLMVAKPALSWWPVS
jgi:hypothetical protein